MNKKEKEEMELNIEAKYVGRTEKQFLNNITYAECLYILDTKNNYCDKIKDLSLLKLVDIISKQQKELDKKNKVIDLIAEELHSIINLGEFIDRKIDKLDTKEEIKEYFYKKVEEENE